MKAIHRALLLLGVLLATPATAQTSYSGLYVFGDSLVDSGNAFIATGGTEAPLSDGYFLGRFSNGPNFADYLSQSLLGSPATPVLLGGTNAGVGGSTAAFIPGAASPSFLEQIALFNTLVGPTISSDALVMVTFGGNDVRRTISVGGPVDFTSATASFSTGLDLLYASGARNFLVVGSADVGLLPRSVELAGAIPGRLGELSSRSLEISRMLQGTSAGFANLTDANVTYFNLFSFEHSVRGDPSAFGLPSGLDLRNPCQVLGAGGPQFANCANSLYFDEIHPTTIAHQAVASALVSKLSRGPGSIPEPATWLMMIAGFGLLGMKLRTTRRKAALVA